MTTLGCLFCSAKSLTCCAASRVSVVSVLIRLMSSRATQDVPLCASRTSHEYLYPYRPGSFCWAFNAPRSGKVSAAMRSLGGVSTAWISYPAIFAQFASWPLISRSFRPTSNYPCTSASYTLLNLRRNKGDSFNATGELTYP